jgi:SAM-dependent methyltransferase
VPGYRYPDPDEEITAHLIDALPGGAASWIRSEELVVDVVLGLAAGRFRGSARCLDAGAGDGRLTRHFGAIFSQVTALELDASRLATEQMREDAREGGYHLSIEIGDAARADELSEAPFDLVVLSHVLQHVSHRACEAILDASVRALSARGMLYVAVPVSYDGERCTVVLVEGGVRREEHVDARTFDALCDEGGGDVLPTRRFYAAALDDSLEQRGLVVERNLAYHFDDGAWPALPLVADVSGAGVEGVIDLAIVASRGGHS